MKKSFSEKIYLIAEKREIFGKKIKKLRKKGSIPANIFGTNFKSLAICIDEKELKKKLRLIKEKPYFYLQLDKEELPVIIHQIQNHSLINQILHVDFRKVNLKEKIEVEIPIKIIGSSDLIEKKGGILLQQRNKLQIESLPENIPSTIEINIEKLKEIGDEIKVKDLASVDQYIIKDDPEMVIVSIIKHKEEKVVIEQSPVETPVSKEETKKVQTEEENSPKESKKSS